MMDARVPLRHQPPVALRQLERRQTLLTPDAPGADDCALLIFQHVGEEDKPLPTLVVYGPGCEPGDRLQQRVHGLTSEVLAFPRYTTMSEPMLLQLRILVEEYAHMQRAKNTQEHRKRFGRRGTFVAISSKPEELERGRVASDWMCNLLSDIVDSFPGHSIQSEALLMSRIVACGGAPAP